MFAVPDNTVALAEKPALRHPVRVAASYAADRTRWSHLLRYDAEERYAVLVDRTEHDEIWLMSWLPGQHTVLHDHGDSSGAFTVVSGQLTEIVTRPSAVEPGRGDVHSLLPGQSRVFGPGYAHQVHNDGIDPAVSLHVYRFGPRTVRAFASDPERGV